MQTIFVIGDVQACYQSLQHLLHTIENIEPTARIWFTGDIVNRGPRSLDALRLLYDNQERYLTVLGNHDLHLLAAASGLRLPHHSDTFTDILKAQDRDQLIDWLRHQPLIHYEAPYLLVHAGLLPQWTAKQAIGLAKEVEAILRGPHWLDFLKLMYSDHPCEWSEQLAGFERARCILNALTRLRFCTEQGAMEFTTKDSTGQAPPGYIPWFEVPSRKAKDVTILFGHWSALGLMLKENLIALDTGCVWGRELTAIQLPQRTIYQTKNLDTTGYS